MLKRTHSRFLCIALYRTSPARWVWQCRCKWWHAFAEKTTIFMCLFSVRTASVSINWKQNKPEQASARITFNIQNEHDGRLQNTYCGQRNVIVWGLVRLGCKKEYGYVGLTERYGCLTVRLKRCLTTGWKVLSTHGTNYARRASCILCASFAVKARERSRKHCL